MQDPLFQNKTDSLFLEIELWVEKDFPDIEWETPQGSLCLGLPGGEQVLLTRQSVLQEVWLAAPSGAYHFALTPQGDWQTRQGQKLWDMLAQLLK